MARPKIARASFLNTFRVEPRLRFVTCGFANGAPFTDAQYSPRHRGELMVFWAAIAAAALVFVIALVSWRRRAHDDALDYDDFVELGRAAWIDLRDEDRTRLTG